MSYGSIKRGLWPRGLSWKVWPPLQRFVVVLCEQRRRTPRCARRSPPSVAALFSHYMTRTVDYTVDLYAANRVFCLPRLNLTPPLWGFRRKSEYRHSVWHGKTRMTWLLDGDKISKISLFVLTQLTNVTDTQTGTAWQHRPRLCIASRGKNSVRCVFSTLKPIITRDKIFAYIE